MKHSLRRPTNAKHHDCDEEEEAMRHNAVQLDTDDSDGYLSTKSTMKKKIPWTLNEK
jgi:hypothetical protein